MRSWPSMSLLAFATLASVSCAPPERARTPSSSAGFPPTVVAEVQNNSAVVVSLLCRRASGSVVRLGTLGTGETRRYELPHGCSRLTAQTVSGRSVIGVLVRYMEERPAAGRGAGQVAGI